MFKYKQQPDSNMYLINDTNSKSFSIPSYGSHEKKDQPKINLLTIGGYVGEWI